MSVLSGAELILRVAKESSGNVVTDRQIREGVAEKGVRDGEQEKEMKYIEREKKRDIKT